MRFKHLWIVLSGILVLSVNAQNKLTIDEAIKLALEKNIEIQKQKTNISNSESNLSNSTQLPNPIFSYTREDLKDGFINYGEWTASGSIPINFLWERWSNIEAKENILESQKLLLEHQQTSLISKVKEAYSAVDIHNRLMLKLNTTLSQLSVLAETAKLRFREGDISEYELQRILIELNKLKFVVSETELQKSDYENILKLLIGYEIEKNLLTEPLVMNEELIFTKNELINLALQNRKDLAASALIIEGENLYLTHNKLKAFPTINLTAGYKEQIDELKGTILQIDFEIPLFNRNQIGIGQSEIELSILEKEKIFLIEKIKADVYETYNRYAANKELIQNQRDIQLQNIFNTAAYSYEQGEISLVEFIDGINAYVDAILLTNRTEINYTHSFYRLQKAVGITLNDFE
ncbi:MAG: TolC family protein [Ignavibacteria bacterium]|nr:TolC family protein [Ignavibacteria bacterium]